jgi:hypothetical protein
MRITKDTKGRQILPSDLKCKIKGSALGSGPDCPTSIFKGRLVCGGHRESHPSTHKTFSPTVMLSHFRLLLADAALQKKDMCLLDFKQAYLLAPPSKKRLIKLPRLVEDVCDLKQGDVYEIENLYGTSDAGRQWWLHLCDILIEAGFTRSKNDACVWIGTGSNFGNVTIATYVDDLAISGTLPEIKTFIALIEASFNVKTELVTLATPSRFLGANITKTPAGGFTLDLAVYIEHMLEEAGMQDCKPASTPLDPSDNVPKAEDDAPMLDAAQAKQYGHISGQIDWVVQFTRPDASVAASKIAQHVSNPSVSNWTSIRHVLRYLRGTSGYKILYSPSKGADDDSHNVLTAYSDASFLSEPKSKSRSGSLITLAGGAVSWRTKKQGPTALSTSEAETVALCKTAQMVVPERRLYAEILRTPHDTMAPTVIYEDNHAAIYTALNDGFVRNGSRHMQVKYHYTRELIAEGLVDVKYMSGETIPADMLTKILARPRAHTLLPSFFGLTHHEMVPAASGAAKPRRTATQAE